MYYINLLNVTSTSSTFLLFRPTIAKLVTYRSIVNNGQFYEKLTFLSLELLSMEPIANDKITQLEEPLDPLI